MYRINLYPEYGAVRRSARLRKVRLVISLCMVALPILFCGALVTSYFILESERDTLETRIPRLSENLRTETRPTLELDVVQQLVQVRQERIDWAPKLAALSARIDSTLQLARVSGRVGVKKTPAYFDLRGKLIADQQDLQIIYDFIDDMREDPRLADDFPNIKMEAFKGGTECQFDLVCRPAGREGR